MATYSSKGGKEFAPVPAGTHLAVCTMVADVGLQPGSGMFPDPKVKVYFRFEIPAERISYEKDGATIDAPAVIYHNYAASMNAKANMRKAVDSWRGKKMTDQEAELFDIKNLLGQSCMLQVVHTPDGKYANVNAIMAPPRGTPKVKPEAEPVYYGPDDDYAYDKLPKFIRDKIDSQLGDTTPKTTGAPAPAPKAGKAPPAPEVEFVDSDLDELPF